MAMALTIAGGVMSFIGQQKQAKAAKQAEAARQQQMNLEAMRKRREIAREAVKARSDALASATSQGAEGGSGLQGGYGQIQGTSGRGIVASNQDQELGNRVFAANRKYMKAGSLVALGGGIQQLGSAFNDYANAAV